MPHRRKQDTSALPCPGCGYDLRGAPYSPKQTSVTCPECGATWLRTQLTGKWRRPDDEPRLGRWGLLAAFSPAILSTLVVGWVFATNTGDPVVMFTVALTTPVILIPLANWRCSHHRSWQKRIAHIVAFIILYLALNALLFLVLIISLIIVIARLDPGHFDV